MLATVVSLFLWAQSRGQAERKTCVVESSRCTPRNSTVPVVPCLRPPADGCEALLDDRSARQTKAAMMLLACRNQRLRLAERIATSCLPRGARIHPVHRSSWYRRPCSRSSPLLPKKCSTQEAKSREDPTLLPLLSVCVPGTIGRIEARVLKWPSASSLAPDLRPLSQQPSPQSTPEPSHAQQSTWVLPRS